MYQHKVLHPLNLNKLKYPKAKKFPKSNAFGLSVQLKHTYFNIAFFNYTYSNAASNAAV